MYVFVPKPWKQKEFPRGFTSIELKSILIIDHAFNNKSHSSLYIRPEYLFVLPKLHKKKASKETFS